MRWLIKTEADRYGWDRFAAEGGTEWDGVRNAAAAMHLRAMRVGDEVLFYHSGAQKQAVGTARVARAARPDGDDGRWVSVRLEPAAPLTRPVTLSAMKADPALAAMPMLRQPRLSVSPVRDEEWAALMQLAGMVGP